MVLAVPLAAVSSSGVLTSLGMQGSDSRAERGPDHGARVAITNTATAGRPPRSGRPAKHSAARITSVLIMTILRGSRRRWSRRTA